MDFSDESEESVIESSEGESSEDEFLKASESREGKISLRELCKQLRISRLEVSFAFANLESSYKCLYKPAVKDGVWPRLFMAWADARGGATKDSAYYLYKIPVMRQALDTEEFQQDTERQQALTALIDLAKREVKDAYKEFFSFAADGMRELQEARTPDAVFNAGLLESKDAIEECVSTFAALANVYPEGMDLISVANLLYEGWSNLDFWKGQPVNTKLEKGKISFAGWYVNSKKERLQDIAEYVVELDKVLDTFEKERAYWLDKLGQGGHPISLDSVKGMVENVKYLYAEVIRCEGTLLHKLDTSATACEEWARYHAGSDYYATLRGSSDELVIWIETTDQAYATIALFATTLATALTTPIGGAVVGGVMGVGGLLKKKVFDQLAVRNKARREGVFTLEYVITSSTIGRIKKKARNTEKKVAKVYSFGLDPALEATQEGLKHIGHFVKTSGVVEGVHGVGTVLGNMSKVLDEVIFATKDTTFRAQRRQAQASQAVVFTSITRDLAQFKQFHRRAGARFQATLATIGGDGGGQPWSDADYAKYYFDHIAENWERSNYQDPDCLDLALDQPQDLTPFDWIHAPNPDLFTFMHVVQPGFYRFRGRLDLSYSGALENVVCEAEFTVTSDGTVINVKFRPLDDVWGGTVWKTGSANQVAGDVGVKAFGMPDWQRYALAAYDKNHCGNQMLVAADGNDKAMLFSGRANYNTEMTKLLKPMPSGFPAVLYDLLATEWQIGAQ
jgi:hypothetical protein